MNNVKNFKYLIDQQIFQFCQVQSERQKVE